MKINARAFAMGHVKYVGRDKNGKINYQHEHDFPKKHNP